VEALAWQVKVIQRERILVAVMIALELIDQRE